MTNPEIIAQFARITELPSGFRAEALVPDPYATITPRILVELVKGGYKTRKGAENAVVKYMENQYPHMIDPNYWA